MTETFASIVDPFVQYVISLQRRFDEPAERHPGLIAVQKDLVRLIQTARSDSIKYERPHDFTHLAEYALIYWADEVLIDSRWVHAKSWRREGLLELELYKKAIGGSDFYVKASEVPDRSIDTLETFYLCVALGFRGEKLPNRLRPAHGADASDPIGPELRRWIAETHKKVRPDLDPFVPDSPGETHPAPRAESGRNFLLRVSVLTAATVLVTLAAWIFVAHSG